MKSHCYTLLLTLTLCLFALCSCGGGGDSNGSNNSYSVTEEEFLRAKRYFLITNALPYVEIKPVLGTMSIIGGEVRGDGLMVLGSNSTESVNMRDMTNESTTANGVATTARMYLSLDNGRNLSNNELRSFLGMAHGSNVNNGENTVSGHGEIELIFDMVGGSVVINYETDGPGAGGTIGLPVTQTLTISYNFITQKGQGDL